MIIDTEVEDTDRDEVIFIGDYGTLSAKKVEDTIKYEYGYPFSRRTIRKLVEEQIIDPKERTMFGGKEYYIFTDAVIDEILIYLLMNTCISGLQKGSKEQNRFQYIALAKEIISEYNTNITDSSVKTFIKYIRRQDVADKLRALCKEGTKNYDLKENILISWYFFEGLLKWKFRNNVYSNWSDFATALSQRGDKNVFNNGSDNVLEIENTNIKKGDNSSQVDIVGRGINMFTRQGEELYSEVGKICKLISNNKLYSKELLGWINIVACFDNNKMWLSSLAKRALQDQIRDIKIEKLFIYAKILNTLGRL